MPTVLITGANRGIGLEFARQYAADGWKVIATARDPGKAGELKAVPGVQVEALEVTDDASVAALAAKLKDVKIDVLLNNAGISGPRGFAIGEWDFKAWEEVMVVNSIAPLRVAQAFLPHVEASDRKIMAFISSRMGSITLNGGGSAFYRSSKTALNMAVSCLALELKDRGVTCAVFHPGWVKTDMGGAGADITTGESVTGLRKVIGGLDIGKTGKFFNYDGAEFPW
ncbi:SDR family oxidoreductase [Oceanibaculum indicum]|uniref:Short-subunit dehydrogenase n=1 Tax=Oceanibaculum indicum TaxID=526216 RepID=A0A420WP27_9PROT|nr:SDR family oxidoreductase [Oceanibaculum indicum]RKQ72777.1 short-subunit dehydrogenase [Oceanibaculum indicum]